MSESGGMQTLAPTARIVGSMAGSCALALVLWPLTVESAPMAGDSNCGRWLSDTEMPVSKEDAEWY